MNALHRGDRVHLTARFAAALPYKKRKMPTDWARAEGTVSSANSLRVRVMWDGKKYADELDPRALERVR